MIKTTAIVLPIKDYPMEQNAGFKIKSSVHARTNFISYLTSFLVMDALLSFVAILMDENIGGKAFLGVAYSSAVL